MKRNQLVGVVVAALFVGIAGGTLLGASAFSHFTENIQVAVVEEAVFMFGTAEEYLNTTGSTPTRSRVEAPVEVEKLQFKHQGLDVTRMYSPDPGLWPYRVVRTGTIMWLPEQVVSE